MTQLYIQKIGKRTLKEKTGRMQCAICHTKLVNKKGEKELRIQGTLG
jgi:hypothetical protein